MYKLFFRWRANQAFTDADPNAANSFFTPKTFNATTNAADYNVSSVNNTRVRPESNAYGVGTETTLLEVTQAQVDAGLPLLFRIGTREAGMMFDRIVLTVGHLVVSDAVALIPEARRALRADGELYVLHPTTGRAALQEALTQAGLTDPRELLRSDDQTAVLVRARPASDQKIV
jgi:hypothetical protein